MGIEGAAFNLYPLLEKLLDYPLHLDTRTSIFSPKSKFNISKWKSIRDVPLRYNAPILLYLVLTIEGSYHLYWLISNIPDSELSQVPQVYVEEVLYYIAVVAGSGLLGITWYMLEKEQVLFCVVVNYLSWKFGLGFAGLPRWDRIPDFQEMFGYGVGIGFGLWGPGVIATVPLIRDFDPVSRFVSNFVGGWSGRILSSILLFCNVAIGGGGLCFLFMSAVLCCMRVSELAKVNLTASQEMMYGLLKDNGRLELRHTTESIIDKAYNIIMNYLVASVSKLLKRNVAPSPMQGMEEIDVPEVVVGTSTSVRNRADANKVFREKYLLHNHLRLVACFMNDPCILLNPLLQGIALVIVVTFNFAVVRFLGRIPMVAVCFITILTVVFVFVNMVILYYAAAPNILTGEFIHFWRGVRLGPEERRLAKSMKVASYSMGPFFNIQRKSAMDVINTMLDYTATAVTL